jgi:hypothetical protein
LPSLLEAEIHHSANNEFDTAECELLTADIMAAEKRLSMLVGRAKSKHDIAIVTRLRLTLYTTLAGPQRRLFGFIRRVHHKLTLRGTTDDPLFRRATAVVELDHALGRPAQDARTDPLVSCSMSHCLAAAVLTFSASSRVKHSDTDHLHHGTR